MLSIRKIGVIGRTYRHLNRYRQILTVLFKYGFGDLVDVLKIEQYLEIGLQMISRKRREQVERLTRSERETRGQTRGHPLKGLSREKTPLPLKKCPHFFH